MKKAFLSLGKVISGLDSKFDEACLKLERKVCNGSTVDEKLDLVDAKVVSVCTEVPTTGKRIAGRTKEQSGMAVVAVQDTAKKVVAKVSKVSKPAATPFQKCTDTPVTHKVVPKVQAIPTTMYCPFCKETLPLEACFCPHCRGQIVVPAAKLGPAPITACKIKGMPPVSVKAPAPVSLGQRIKLALTTDISLLTKPMAKVRVR